eukprot:589430-Pelagomonas_calceolata.AAC.1
MTQQSYTFVKTHKPTKERGMVGACARSPFAKCHILFTPTNTPHSYTNVNTHQLRSGRHGGCACVEPPAHALPSTLAGSRQCGWCPSGPGCSPAPARHTQ